MRKRKNKSQTLTEYVVLLGLVTAALIGTKVYSIRVLQEKFRQSADVFGAGEQYESGLTTITNLDGATVSIPGSDIIVESDSCVFIASQVSGWEATRDSLSASAGSLESSAANIQAQIPAMRAQVDYLRGEANQKLAQAANLRAQANAKIAEADQKQAQVDSYRQTYPGCFDSSDWHYWGSYCDDYSCESYTNCALLRSQVAQLESEIVNLRNEATSLNNQAAGLEAEAAELNAYADDLEYNINELEAKIPEMQNQAALNRQQAEDLQAQIDTQRAEHADCFSAAPS